MEVAPLVDSETHATIGGNEAEALTIAADGHFITVLSDTLYSHPRLAVVREVICNAWDAHKDAGITDKPIAITVDSSFLTIRDFGKGIPAKEMTSIFGTYGGSSKRQQANQTGGFGLGSKSPFAYSDHFIATTRHGGFMNVFQFSRDTSETGNGMPGNKLMVADIPCGDETGVEIKIAIKNQEDVALFRKLAQGVLVFGGINGTLNGVPQEYLNLEDSPHKIGIIRRGLNYHSHDVLLPVADASSEGNIFVQYGNVIYPLFKDSSYAEEHLLVRDWLQVYRSTSPESPNGIILYAEPNSLSMTPSREELRKSQRNIETLGKLLKNAIEVIKQYDGGELIKPHIDAHVTSIIKESNELSRVISCLFNQEDPNSFYNHVRSKLPSVPTFSTDLKEHAIRKEAYSTDVKSRGIIIQRARDYLTKMQTKFPQITDHALKIIDGVTASTEQKEWLYNYSYMKAYDVWNLFPAGKKLLREGLITPDNLGFISLYRQDRSGFRSGLPSPGKDTWQTFAEACETLNIKPTVIALLASKVIRVFSTYKSLGDYSVRSYLPDEVKAFHELSCHFPAIKIDPKKNEHAKIIKLLKDAGYTVLDSHQATLDYRAHLEKMAKHNKIAEMRLKDNLAQDESSEVKFKRNPKKGIALISCMATAIQAKNLGLTIDSHKTGVTSNILPRVHLDVDKNYLDWLPYKEAKFYLTPYCIDSRNLWNFGLLCNSDTYTEDFLRIFGKEGIYAYNSVEQKKCENQGLVHFLDYTIPKLIELIQSDPDWHPNLINLKAFEALPLDRETYLSLLKYPMIAKQLEPNPSSVVYHSSGHRINDLFGLLVQLIRRAENMRFQFSDPTTLQAGRDLYEMYCTISPEDVKNSKYFTQFSENAFPRIENLWGDYLFSNFIKNGLSNTKHKLFVESVLVQTLFG